MRHQRSSVQIYLKSELHEDALMLKVWDACGKYDRPQMIFRAMLKAGLLAMVEQGTMPERVIDECDLDRLLERARGRSMRKYDQPAYSSAPMYHMPAQPPFAPPAMHQHYPSHAMSQEYAPRERYSSDGHVASLYGRPMEEVKQRLDSQSSDEGAAARNVDLARGAQHRGGHTSPAPAKERVDMTRPEDRASDTSSQSGAGSSHKFLGLM